MITFIGAGPGDPELITVKGQKAVRNADVIIYAGSLVPVAVIEDRKPGAEVYNSATMDLEEIISVMKTAHEQGKNVARVHTGDPSIYGSIREQIEELDKLKIPHTVIPGVSSFVASAAALQREFTVPGISQTVICTRMEGRTPVPELEKIELLASHKTSMAIFLTIGMIDKLVEKLTIHYPVTTPIAVVQRASWPDQKIVTGCLNDIAAKIKEADITKTAMILVGDFLGDNFENSLLYASHFTHEYRKGK
ncbi:precorrin-4 C(11)-methyltransferase [Plebeiibacterium marinum]|uniref:Precorrin-4 C(11)-methyltransferase n=1 Tax=Plebeiibacterium marinum TaxID=2992111 RepID=A0AAE3MGQ6_9BACT|nr:precorrin-4 C(11)-methyltransferase [Plebeiobacterium marinum]MCW3807180.1 precorrin-4 C(11)-methyltransferase [Plebeiobacterium marinum]